ncbi:DNA recombination protein RmuC [Sphaerotilus hippei]|uniref:DNA recombination protein RmuC n=1 Tax=Sphaerotilus hippei TaxID=744406 RepID=A0A318H324_9BURK|nr:DNA recombination protein RmuC [Sphaerotilus hippei]PXW95279.1 DNA recombination protein RmuC [Sphaerotilus hippei]
MSDRFLLWALLLVAALHLLLWLWRSFSPTRSLALEDALADAVESVLRESAEASARARALEAERLERSLREEVQGSARGTRQELGATLADFQRLLMLQSGDGLRTQNEQIDALRLQLAGLQQGQADSLQSFARQQHEQLHLLTEANDRRLATLQQGIEQRLVTLQAGVDQRLGAMQADNERKLEQMRATVDEKLHATLEQRLGESFRQVADRLEQVHRGLGEMQHLAQGVGDLKRVLSNVKSRGLLGEVQLAALLEQVFTIEQYATNVATVPGSGERVEFAIRLPGRGSTATDAPVWLPIDAKFPREDYERLLDAQDRADREAAEQSARALEQRIRDEARSIAAKYLAPPHTTDFAILFLPTEGLYAELLRRPGLSEALQREHRVTLAGPTTLLAMLNSLQMGFRTLALERRSSEVWKVLGAVKTEFGKFGEVLEKTRKKLQEASNTIDAAEVRTRAMSRQLRSVEALSDDEAARLLKAPEPD